MMTFGHALADPHLAGLYRTPVRLPPAMLRRAAGRAGLAFYRLDGGAITDKATFLRACADALAFPPYFGRNWDALQDCLTDLVWLPQQGRVLLYDRPAPFQRHAPAEWREALDILAVAVDYWRGTPTPLWVFLGGPGLVPGAPPPLLRSHPRRRRR